MTELIPDDLSEEQRIKAKEAIEAAAVAGTLDPDLRGKHADMMISRVHGKPKEQVEHSGNVDSVTRVVLEIERKPEAKTVEGTVSHPKALRGADAE